VSLVLLGLTVMAVPVASVVMVLVVLFPAMLEGQAEQVVLVVPVAHYQVSVVMAA
jgi:hypothetical protein